MARGHTQNGARGGLYRLEPAPVSSLACNHLRAGESSLVDCLGASGVSYDYTRRQSRRVAPEFHSLTNWNCPRRLAGYRGRTGSTDRVVFLDEPGSKIGTARLVAPNPIEYTDAGTPDAFLGSRVKYYRLENLVPASSSIAEATAVPEET